jgi:hypothetical protein
MKIELRLSFWISGRETNPCSFSSPFTGSSGSSTSLRRHGGGCGSPTRSSGSSALTAINWSSVSLPKT